MAEGGIRGFGFCEFVKRFEGLMEENGFDGGDGGW